MNYSFFNQSVPQRNYLPDAIYSLCGEDTQECDNCSNVLWSPVVNGYVHDTLRGKVFCPFGQGNSMNKRIYGDQSFLVKLTPGKFEGTTWGRAPQLDPRPLAQVGLEWRTT
jgi:hypothetical protein